MLAKEIMTHPAVTARIGETLEDAVHRLWDRDAGAAVVLGVNGKCIGIVTDRDACMAVLHHRRPLHDIPVEAAMSKDVITVGPDEPIACVDELMAANQVCRIPVVDELGMTLGIVTLADIANAYLRIGAGRHEPLEGGPLAIAVTLANCGDCRPHRRAA